MKHMKNWPSILTAFPRDFQLQIPAPIYSSFIVPLNWMQQDGVFSERPENPVCFVGNNLGIHGSGDNVTLPEGIGKIDMEAELGVLIAKGAYDIPKEQAAERIAGYILRNDLSQRDLQAEELKK